MIPLPNRDALTVAVFKERHCVFSGGLSKFTEFSDGYYIIFLQIFSKEFDGLLEGARMDKIPVRASSAENSDKTSVFPTSCDLYNEDRTRGN